MTNSAYAWTGHGSGSVSSTADGLNRLTAQGGTGYSYDAKGNMIDYGDSALNSGVEERLVWYEGPGTADRRFLQTDALDRMIFKDCPERDDVRSR